MDWLIGHFPARAEYIHRVHVFGGGGSDLLACEPEGVSEVYNDRHWALTNFWLVLQDEAKFQEFSRRVAAVPFSQFEYSSAELFRLRADRKWTDGEVRSADVEAAVAFFVLNRQSRQGTMKSFATLSKSRVRRGMNEQAAAWLSAVEGLPDLHDRLKRVVIVHDDFEAVIDREDRPETFFYLDPPYVAETRVSRDAYDLEMSEEDHLRLLRCLSRIRGKFLLSGYPSPLYREFTKTKPWFMNHKMIDNKASSSVVKDLKMETVWMNYRPRSAEMLGVRTCVDTYQ